MPEYIDILSVVLIVGAALFFMVRRYWQSYKGKGGCGCSGCSGCSGGAAPKKEGLQTKEPDNHSSCCSGCNNH